MTVNVNPTTSGLGTVFDTNTSNQIQALVSGAGKLKLTKTVLKARSLSDNFRIGIYGHSIVNGQGSDATQANWPAKNFVSQIAKQLATKTGLTVTNSLVVANDASWTLSGTTVAGTYSGFLYYFNLLNATQNATITKVCGAVRVYFIAAISNVVLTYKIDGGSAQTATIVSSTLLANGLYMQCSELAAGTYGSHAVQIIGPTAGYATVLFAEFADNFLTGKQVYSYGVNGIVAPDMFVYLANTGANTIPAGAGDTTNNKLMYRDTKLSLLSPDLSIFMFDVNDMSANSWSPSFYGRDLARISTEITQLCTDATANGGAALLLCGPWADKTNPAYSACPYTQEQITAVYQAVANSLPNVGFLDIRAPLFSSWSDANAAGVMADFVHPKHLYCCQIAQQILDAVC